MNTNKYILYDAKCSFCSKIVRYVLIKSNVFTAIPVQNKEARSVLRMHNITFIDLNTIYFIDNKFVYTKSRAIFNIIRYTSFPLKVLFIFSFLPKRLTDKVYLFVAKNRHIF